MRVRRRSGSDQSCFGFGLLIACFAGQRKHASRSRVKEQRVVVRNQALVEIEGAGAARKVDRRIDAIDARNGADRRGGDRQGGSHGDGGEGRTDDARLQ